MSEGVLPSIERWWPHIDIEFKHEILADLNTPLSESALAQLYGLCGEPAATGSVTLTEREKSYILTQTEFVD